MCCYKEERKEEICELYTHKHVHIQAKKEKKEVLTTYT